MGDELARRLIVRLDQRSYSTLGPATTWTGDCLRTGKPSRYITNLQVNSAFHPSRVNKSINQVPDTRLPSAVKAGLVHLSDALICSEMNFHEDWCALLTFINLFLLTQTFVCISFSEIN